MTYRSLRFKGVPLLRFKAVLLAAVLLTAGPLAAAPASARAATVITVTDDHGTAITLAAVPHRLIALAPNVTEILFALGLGREVVGVSSYSNYPAAATKLPVVFTYTGMNYEKAISLKPDLIVAAALVPAATVAKLRSLHLTVLVTDPHDLAGILRDIRLVGAATGAGATANALSARLQARIDHVRAVVRTARTHPRVFYELDSTLYSVGRGSFVDALITAAGGVNVAATSSNPYPQLSREALLAANPDDYILGDATGGVTPASVAARPGFALLAAVKHHHVYAFNDDLASRPGPRIVDGLETLARIIHPELFH